MTGPYRNGPTRSISLGTSVRVSGYPAAFRIDLGSAALRDGAITPSPEFHIPVLSGTARPWDFADWRLAAPEGFTADFAAAGGRTPAKLIAQTADGVVSIGSEGGWTSVADLRARLLSRLELRSASVRPMPR